MLNENIARNVSAMHTPNMKKVINGTGTILHTNLGRAPISYEHMMKAAEIVSGYSNLEYNLEAGRRGERYSHFEKLLCKLTGAEAAMAVNNNASSVLLILSSLAKGGGMYRIPWRADRDWWEVQNSRRYGAKRCEPCRSRNDE